MKKIGPVLLLFLLNGLPAYGQLFQAAPSTQLAPQLATASEVIFPFNEGYPADQFYFLQRSPDSDIEVKRSDDAIEGEDASVRASWDIAIGDSQNGFAGFGYLHRAARDTIPDLSAYDYLSLWHKDLEAPDKQIRFRFQLHEDSTVTNDDGEEGSETWVYARSDVIGSAPSWSELRISLDTYEPGGTNQEGFVIPAGGFVGDRKLDWDGIKHWSILLVADEEVPGTVLSGVTLFDLLTAQEGAVSTEDPPFSSSAPLLAGNFPNPFHTITTIRYALPRPTRVSIAVFNLLGQKVATPVDGRLQAAGEHAVRFDASQLAAGSYICQLVAEGQRHATVMTVVHR